MRHGSGRPGKSNKNGRKSAQTLRSYISLRRQRPGAHELERLCDRHGARPRHGPVDEQAPDRRAGGGGRPRRRHAPARRRP
ncbi:hypothetical protein DJ71_15880, partial [Halorubrum sp. E3]